MKIYIPTKGRVDNQITFRNLPAKLQREAKLVVYESEMKEHFTKYGEDKVLVVPSHCKGISQKRQAIMDYHDPIKDGSTMIMLDDDLNFDMRRTDVPDRFLVATEEAIIAGFALVENLLESHIHGGIRHRQMANQAPLIDYNCRVQRAQAYNVRKFKQTGVRFDRLAMMEDFDVTLQLLRLGHSNFNISSLIQGQPASNTKGGCSTFRNSETQAAAANGLAALHPEFVKVRVKKTNWKDWGSDERLDVTVSWKKAYESSRTSA